MDGFKKIVKIFKYCYPDYNLSVRRLALSEKIYGDCNYLPKENKFLIRIRRDLDEDCAIETFLHEMAHVLSWDAAGDEHGAAWGKAYSNVYRIYLEQCVKPTWFLEEDQ